MIMFEIEKLLSQINIDLQDIEKQQQDLLNQETILIKNVDNVFSDEHSAIWREQSKLDEKQALLKFTQKYIVDFKISEMDNIEKIQYDSLDDYFYNLTI